MRNQTYESKTLSRRDFDDIKARMATYHELQVELARVQLRALAEQYGVGAGTIKKAETATTKTAGRITSLTVDEIAEIQAAVARREEIRERLERYRPKAIQQEYGITSQCIHQVMSGRLRPRRSKELS